MPGRVSRAPAKNLEVASARSTSAFTLSATATDVPGMQMAVTGPGLPLVLRCSGLASINKGTAATGAAAQIKIAVYDLADLVNAVASTLITGTVLPAGPLTNPYFFEEPIVVAAGATKTYKMQAWITVLPTGGAAVLNAANDFKIKLAAYTT